MTAPLTFITTYALKSGELEEFREFVRGLLDPVEANEPRALAINGFRQCGWVRRRDRSDPHPTPTRSSSTGGLFISTPAGRSGSS